ncbi:helix-turn-helix transcriptional regulator [Brevundimonas kwangchunensis]|uniref:Helix-turn-helix transcriptional regulator n=1 Tax=Brevundimonas kwangchunensis TaxID=322163 RepID=A0ABP3RJG3_9CAUL
MESLPRCSALPLGKALRLARRARGLKQSHVAELVGVGQPIISRIEHGEHAPSGHLRDRLVDLLSARLDPAQDSGLRRLIETSSLPVHLICDVTHRLLATSPAREREWGRSAAEACGISLWRYATEDIRDAEARLPSLGWGDRRGSHALALTTSANGSTELSIAAGPMLWERIVLSDGSAARLVTRPI